MEFGNASWGFRDTELEEQLKITKDMGLRILELGIANAPNDLPLEASDNDIDKVKNLYDKYGISLMYAATGNDFSAGDSNDLDKVKKTAFICGKLGVKYLRIFSGFSPVQEVTRARWDNMIFCLRNAALYCKNLGVVLCIETHGGVNGFDDGVVHYQSASTLPETLCKMLWQLPENVKVTFDAANLWAVGMKEPQALYEKIKHRVAYLHLKDFVTLESGHMLPAACGESDMDWKMLLSAFSDFNGAALFEYENTEDIKAGLERCYSYIKSIEV